MVTPSRVRMNKLRHMHGRIAKNKQEEIEKEKSWKEKSKKSISEEEHKKRLNKLKNIGLIKNE